MTISQYNSIIILWPVIIRREKMITYKLNHTPEDGFNTFGISAFCGKKLIKSVSGISESFREMTELVEMCNELELELCQLDDIIEDYLTDFTL